MTRYLSWLGALLGCMFFFLIYGVRILDPEFIQWTLKGDAATHFLGWHFFRSEPWSFPLGVINSYQYPQGTSLVYTDSIPLLAILFKLISPVLTETFQYHGLWVLIVYILQGFFSVLLLSQVSKNPWIIVLGSLFFLMNPVLVQRSRAHEALTAHWLILAALYLYMQKDSLRNHLLWLVTTLLAVLIHFYLLFMVLAIWGGYLLKIYLEANRTNFKQICQVACVILMTILLVMWLVGYFVIETKSSASGGFGIFSMNLLAPINPVPHRWFTFLRPIRYAVSGQYEGNNYFGFGLLLLVFLAIYEFIRNQYHFSIKKVLPLLLVCVVLSIVSISNKVTFSDLILFEVPLSDTLLASFGVLRSSGRFFWPVTYCVMLGCIVVISRSGTGKYAVSVLLVLVIVQLIDFLPMYRRLDLKKNQWTSPLVSHYWESLAEQYQHLVVVPPDRGGEDYVPFSLLAATHGLTINVGYTARFDRDARNVYAQKLLQTARRGEFESGSLYILRDTKLFKRLKNDAQIDSVTLDGFAIVAHGMKKKVPQLFAQ